MFMEPMGFYLFMCFGITVSSFYIILSTWCSRIISLLLIRKVYNSRKMKAWCPVAALKKDWAVKKETMQRQRQNVKSKFWNLVQFADFHKSMFSYGGWRLFHKVKSVVLHKDKTLYLHRELWPLMLIMLENPLFGLFFFFVLNNID